ncbi:hypothetical protein BJV78DRAFT_1183767 [Lactifluus subvellereus]|nr:hypothetical protein BJV78DRAFT_1183767 [Lactifluus subvellereus]
MPKFLAQKLRTDMRDFEYFLSQRGNTLIIISVMSASRQIIVSIQSHHYSCNPYTYSEIMSQLPSTGSSPKSLLSDVQDEQSSSVPLPQQPSAISDTARQERLAALERRLGGSSAKASNTPDVAQEPQPFDANHTKRIEFRRLVDPGIVRPNSKEVALRTLHTLSTIAENLLREPDNPKFRQFKSTNTIIKRDLVDPKGALEYAVAMGFRPEVDHFQPYYSFNNKHMTDLRVGASILREALQTVGKEEDEGLKVRTAKAEEEIRVKKAKEAFLEDRKAQMLRTERERRLRHQEERAQAQSPTPTS